MPHSHSHTWGVVQVGLSTIKSDWSRPGPNSSVDLLKPRNTRFKLSKAKTWIFRIGVISFEGLASQTLDYDKVFGVRQNDTCFSVTQLFNLTQTVFEGLDPNLNCDKLFVCQWLCIKESIL
ncbi:hypothetical protein AMTRI_Chr08g162940 [Amborella trichopoda]